MDKKLDEWVEALRDVRRTLEEDIRRLQANQEAGIRSPFLRENSFEEYLDSLQRARDINKSLGK